MRTLCGFVVLFACATFAVGQNSTLPERPEYTSIPAIAPNYRLPNNTRPISYDVHLTTHIHTQNNFNFSGEVTIRISVLQSSRRITLHQRQLSIGTVTLVSTSAPNQLIELDPPHYIIATEFLEITPKSEVLDAGSVYILTIQYDGALRTDNGGFYRSSYISADATERWLAATQLVPTDARHAFPCYDEPGRRALITIRITHGSGFHALSNMPAVSTLPSSKAGYTTTTFAETTAPIPPYLVAIIVSDFSYKTKANDRGFVQRVFTRPNAIENAEHALDYGVKILDAYEQYFGINFTLPKMDQAAIPDFYFGAMENWGLVFYREEFLLFNESQSLFNNRHKLVTIVSHEYAHQWFGNLVSPKWWTYVWLNEGFATLYEYYGTDWIHPEWKILDSFVSDVLQNVMVVDAMNTTRPMSYYVEEPNAVLAIYDKVVYDKAGCVLHMLLNAFTESSFKKGVISYLHLRKYTDAVEDDLFDQLEKAVKTDGTLNEAYNVPEIFASWTRQAGFPLVTVERDYRNGHFVLSQERYLADSNNSTNNPSIWYIPYNVATSQADDFSVTSATAWLSTRMANSTNTIVRSNDWLLLNKRQSGYYRVKYDLPNYKLLSDALVRNHSRIHLVSRSQLIDDAFDLARTERLSYAVALDFTKYLQRELEYVPWASAIRGLKYIDRMYAESSGYAGFSNYIAKQMAHIYKQAGLTAQSNEHHYRKITRNHAIHWSCRMGSKVCLQDTSYLLNKHLNNRVFIHQDHRLTILCNGIRSANETQFNLLASRLKTADKSERNNLIDALACTSNDNLKINLLKATIDNGSFLQSPDERFRAFKEILANSPRSTELAIEFLQVNMDVAFERYGLTNFERAISHLATFVVSDNRVLQFESLCTTINNSLGIDFETFATVRKTVQANRRWNARNEKVINDWIKANDSSHCIASVMMVAVMLIVSQLC